MSDEEKSPTTPQLKTNSTDDSTENASPGPASSEDVLVMDDPNYIAPHQQNFTLWDVTSEFLHSNISEELEGDYLSPALGVAQTSPLRGILFGNNGRLLVNIATRARHSPHVNGNGPTYNDAYNVTFLCNSGSPNTFICAEAMNVLLGRSSEDAPPPTLLVQLADFPFLVEAHLSTQPSHYQEVNVLGMDVLRQLKVTIYGKNLSFNGIYAWSIVRMARTTAKEHPLYKLIKL